MFRRIARVDSLRFDQRTGKFGDWRSAEGLVKPGRGGSVALVDVIETGDDAEFSASGLDLPAIAVDWSHRESARARMRVLGKRILRKYGDPPDLQDAAVQVLRQAEALSAKWAARSRKRIRTPYENQFGGIFGGITKTEIKIDQ